MIATVVAPACAAPLAAPRARRVACPALLALALVGCGAPESGVQAEPAALVFSPAATQLELSLVNRGELAVPLSRIRFDSSSPDWGAFVLEDREHPREIAAGGAVSLHLRVDRDHFTRRGPDHVGRARLVFVAGATPQAVDLRYQPPDPAAELRIALVRSVSLLGLVALAWAWLRRRRQAGVRLAWTSWLPALVVLALLPLGPGLCPGALDQALSAADTDQCAAGRGGVPFGLLAVSEGWLVYLVALVIAGLGQLAGRDLGPAQASRIALRDFALALAFAGPLLAFGVMDPRLLVGEQATGLFGAAAIFPRWGLFVQPVAAAVALAVVAGSPPSLPGRLAFAAAFSACFLAGHTLPGLALYSVPHALALAVGVAVLAAKVAAIAWLVQALGALRSGSSTRAAVLAVERVAVPLAVVSLLVTSAYAWLR